MAISGGPDIVEDGLVLHLDAADRNSYPGSGTTWYDLSGNGNNGTLINGPTFNIANYGNILTDGVNDYISLVNNDGLGNSFASFSIDLTILTRTGQGESAVSYILHRSTTAIVGTSVYAIYMANNSLTFTINGLSNIMQISNRNNIIANYFYVWNGSTVYSYVNGVFNQSISFSTFSNTVIGSVCNLGGTSINPGYRPANCNFFNVKIYNRALSTDEILQNYNATKGRFGL